MAKVKHPDTEDPSEGGTKQQYLVLVQIGGAGDPEIYRVGSGIWLDDVTAAAHLLAGNVAAINATVAPVVEVQPEAEIIHGPEAN